jgi:hypothetical protein
MTTIYGGDERGTRRGNPHTFLQRHEETSHALPPLW